MKEKIYALKAKAVCGFDSLRKRAERNLCSNKGDFVETLIKILISVVVGAVVLGLLVLLMKTLFPEVEKKIVDFFSGVSVDGGS